MIGELTKRQAVKASAIRFFDEHSKLWAGRYSDPGTRSLLADRHRTVLEMIEEWKPPVVWRFLDIGCGAGLLISDLSRIGLRGVGIDGAASMIEFCKAESRQLGNAGAWQYEQADVEQIPFPDQSFDVAICCGVVEYLPDDGPLLQEVHRILRPGGRFLLSVTNRYSYSMSLYPLFQQLKRIPGVIQVASAIRGLRTGRKEMMNLPCSPRRHSPAEIRSALATNGFRFEKDRFCGFSLFPGPFNVFFSRSENWLASAMGKLSQTGFRRFGCFYIVSARVD
jgi:ubiquinone/menaquinone biosynthesis C-methylase UbiE